MRRAVADGERARVEVHPRREAVRVGQLDRRRIRIERPREAGIAGM